MEKNYQEKNYYSKKSIWKLILIYLIVGAIAYGAIYYFFFYNKGGYTNKSQNTNYKSQTENSNTADWKTYTNNEYGFEVNYPNNWNAGISPVFPNVVLFCPSEISSYDPEVICRLKESVGHADSQAPIIFNLIQKKLQLNTDSSQYNNIFQLMNTSLKFTK